MALPFFFAKWAMMTVGIIRPVYRRHQWLVKFPIGTAGACNGHGSNGSSVKRIPECDNARSACNIFCQLHGTVIDFCTGVAEVHFGISSCQFHQAFCQFYIRFIVDHIMPHVDHSVQLFPDGLHHLRIFISQIIYSNTTGKIQDPAPILRINITPFTVHDSKSRRPVGHRRHYLAASFIHTAHRNSSFFSCYCSSCFPI